MLDAGFFLLSIIVIFTAVVLVRKHRRRVRERGQDAAKPRPAESAQFCRGLTVSERLNCIISDILWTDISEAADTLSALGADPHEISDIITDCEDEFKIEIPEAVLSSISGQTTVGELEALLRESGATDLEPVT